MIPNSNFILPEIPILHPKSMEYLEFWRQEKRSCIEGYWVSGKWMPGPLYFYVNYWHILLNKKRFSKVKSLGKPFLRDIEWAKAYVYTEAKGFSGFADDDVYTCHRIVAELEEKYKDTSIPEDEILLEELDEHCFNSKGEVKKYTPARDYLPKVHSKNMGKPLFFNYAKNVVDIECFAPETEVLMGDSTKQQIKNINVGDYVMSPSGPVLVKDKFTGTNDMYELTAKNGHKQVVSKGHLVHLLHNKEHKNIKVEDLAKKGNTESFRNRYQLYRRGYMEGTPASLKVDPYTLGVWLSDGRTAEASITMCDLEPLQDIAEKCNVTIKKDKAREGRKQSYTIYMKNTKEMREHSLIGNKHIPKAFMNTFWPERLELLAGIIDGDGSLQHNMFHIGEPKKELALQYVDLARSVGLYSTMTPRRIKSGSILYDVSIGGDVYLIPTRIKRKQAPVVTKTRSYTRFGFTVTPLGTGEFVGIEVDSDDALFLLSDYTVVHNCRGSGKSYWAAGGMIAHNWLFDGATDYDELYNTVKAGSKMTSETLVGAITSFYSGSLLKKVQTGLNNLEGGVLIGEEYYPSPFSKKYIGSFAAAKSVIAEYDEYEGNTKKTKGSGSVIHHKTFKDNPTAANGTRPGLTILEEVGFMGNVQEAMGSLKECTADGADKFGVVYLFGTGGDMEGGTTQAVQEIFYEPDQWDCLAFEDPWEGKKEIGYFVPYTMGLNQFKDSEGNTEFEKAMPYIEKKRLKLAAGSSKKPLNDELQNNPIKPSEAFLVTAGNVFPIAELREQLGKVESRMTTNVAYRGDKGELVLDSEAPKGVSFVNDVNNNLSVAPFPVKKGQDAPGCIQIWEHPPADQIPYGMYIAGTDPYDQDRAPHTTSLGSTFIYKIGEIREGGMAEMIVAEYTGRPGTVKEHHENVRKLLMYFNALDLYENERNSLRMHFEHKNSLYLLADTPDVLKATANSKVSRGKGIHMNKFIKEEIELYARDWLLETASIGDEDGTVLNLEKIFSVGLLKELISYNETGNFDRVIAFMLCICNRLQHHHVKITKKKDNPNDGDDFFNLEMFK